MSARPLFVIGVPRSGTTWAMLLLAQHPQVAACQQAGLFHALQPLAEWWRKGGTHGKKVVTVAGEASGEGSAAGYSRKEIRDLLAFDDFGPLARPLVAHVVDQIVASKPGARYFVEQTPENVELAALILAVLPEASFLHVIRDPRSVFTSLRSAASAWQSAFPTSPVEAARAWCSLLDQGRSLSRLGNRYREVRYEALVENGTHELQGIFEWMELPAVEADCRAAVERCQIGKLRGSGLAPDKFFRKGEVDSWREDATPSEVRCIEYIARDRMAQLGYSSVYPSGRQPARIWMRDNARRMLGPTVKVARPAWRKIKTLGGLAG